MLNNIGRERILKLIELPDGEPETIHTLEQRTGHWLSHTWSIDNKFVILTNNRPPEKSAANERGKSVGFWPWSLFYVPINGGEPLEIDLSVHLVRRHKLHPDGRHVVFGSFGLIKDLKLQFPSIWMMENIMSVIEK